MPSVGYARVSSTGQSLEIQQSKLNEFGCDRIYSEKRSGTTASRPEFKKCMEYLREDDTLVITRLDRLARSVIHLSKLADRFKSENINLVVLDQAIDTTTPTGRLMFNMLSSIAEFENDLRAERQREGIERAIENGVKFGRPKKRTPDIDLEIINCRSEGVTIGNICKQFELGEATTYRILKEHSNQQDIEDEQKI